MSEEQERLTRNQSMAIARCYPMKNRDPDYMPCEYDPSLTVLWLQKSCHHIGKLNILRRLVLKFGIILNIWYLVVRWFATATTVLQNAFFIRKSPAIHILI